MRKWAFGVIAVVIVLVPVLFAALHEPPLFVRLGPQPRPPHWVCAAKLAALCVTEDLAEAVEIDAPVPTFDVKGRVLPHHRRGNTEVWAVLPDKPSRFIRADLNAACSEHRCVWYHKFCRPTSCTYDVSAPQPKQTSARTLPWAYTLWVMAANPSELQRTSLGVRITTNGDEKSPREYLTLNRLDRLSRSEYVAFCDRQGFPPCPAE